MTISLVLVIVMAVLFACGVYAMLERSLTRVLIGFLLLGNAANLLLLIVMGAPGRAPFYDGQTDPADMSDALPQALTLTAIVITFGISAFLLALIYRSWQLGQADTVIDDADDVALRTRTATEPEDAMDEESRSDDDDVTTDFVGDVASPIRVLHQGDLSQLVDDAPVDRVAVQRDDDDAPTPDSRDPQDGDRP
ncbi:MULTISPECIES: Na(+)/H(+) antiporter subunit C [unclassified Microbacterium]|uniref:Na(+)/H(+) antiporter subunit C n=1 Tax=unclassified Microbacterium TaxID=2609290 RepID=UPI0006F5793B|nr:MULTISPECIES: Na(+)/H(+) antiporter subunit C [unclassified Microbacterium]AOX45855.1 sodium:proton antiporter [Microbacterium sp. BH-3-3-3]KQR88446.1 sodium:proton antiporter [Microbacterium sp. Leaf179]MBD8477121.1 Na(+)/H(+) antiporter subunit C [Microbacterium sp. CFBP 8794]